VIVERDEAQDQSSVSTVMDHPEMSLFQCELHSSPLLTIEGGQQIGQPSPVLGAQPRNKIGQGIVVQFAVRNRFASATGSATSILARRNLFVYSSCNGRRSGLQAEVPVFQSLGVFCTTTAAVGPSF
jgi:hypothetical protein